MLDQAYTDSNRMDEEYMNDSESSIYLQRKSAYDDRVGSRVSRVFDLNMCQTNHLMHDMLHGTLDCFRFPVLVSFMVKQWLSGASGWDAERIPELNTMKILYDGIKFIENKQAQTPTMISRDFFVDYRDKGVEWRTNLETTLKPLTPKELEKLYDTPYKIEMARLKQCLAAGRADWMFYFCLLVDRQHPNYIGDTQTTDWGQHSYFNMLFHQVCKTAEGLKCAKKTIVYDFVHTMDRLHRDLFRSFNDTMQKLQRGSNITLLIQACRIFQFIKGKKKIIQWDDPEQFTSTPVDQIDTTSLIQEIKKHHMTPPDPNFAPVLHPVAQKAIVTAAAPPPPQPKHSAAFIQMQALSSSSSSMFNGEVVDPVEPPPKRINGRRIAGWQVAQYSTGRTKFTTYIVQMKYGRKKYRFKHIKLKNNSTIRNDIIDHIKTKLNLSSASSRILKSDDDQREWIVSDDRGHLGYEDCENPNERYTEKVESHKTQVDGRRGTKRVRVIDKIHTHCPPIAVLEETESRSVVSSEDLDRLYAPHSNFWDQLVRALLWRMVLKCSDSTLFNILWSYSEDNLIGGRAISIDECGPASDAQFVQKPFGPNNCLFDRFFGRKPNRNSRCYTAMKTQAVQDVITPLIPAILNKWQITLTEMLAAYRIKHPSKPTVPRIIQTLLDNIEWISTEKIIIQQ